MTKIAITTKYSAFNFGAMLQTYALYKSIKKLGAECFIIDADRKTPNRMLLSKSPYVIINNIFYLLHKKEIELGYKRFNAFLGYFQLSNPYSDYWALKNNPPQADVYLTGSDQVWNPLNIQENYLN